MAVDRLPLALARCALARSRSGMRSHRLGRHLRSGRGQSRLGLIVADRLVRSTSTATATSRRGASGLLRRSSAQLGEVLDRFRPDEAAVEETFVNKNPASTLKLGVARGVVLLAPAERGIPVAEYSANLVKKSVVGVGHADKAQVADDGAPAAAGLHRGQAPTPPTRSRSRSATRITRHAECVAAERRRRR